MIVQQTFAVPGVWQPDIEGNTQKKLAGPAEVSCLKLSANAGAAYVFFYDSPDANGCSPTALRWFLDASTQDVDCQVFVNPVIFTKGVFAVLTQGAGLNPVIGITAINRRPS